MNFSCLVLIGHTLKNDNNYFVLDKREIICINANMKEITIRREIGKLILTLVFLILALW